MRAAIQAKYGTSVMLVLVLVLCACGAEEPGALRGGGSKAEATGTSRNTVATTCTDCTTTHIDFLTPSEGGIFDSYQIDELAIDWENDFGYFLESDYDASLAGIRRFRLSTMQEDKQIRMTDVTSITPNNFPGALFSDREGHLYLTAGSGNTKPILQLHRDTLQEVGRFGFSSSGLSNSPFRFVFTSWMGTLSADSQTGRSDFLLTGSIFDDVGLLRIDSSGLSYVWGSNQRVDEPRVRGVVGGASYPGYGEGWILGSGNGTSHSQLGLYRLQVANTASYDGYMTSGVTFTKVATLTAEQLAPEATSFFDTAGGLTYDPSDNSVIFQVGVNTSSGTIAYYTLKVRSDGGIAWTTKTPSMINYEGPFFGQSRLNGLWTLMRSGRFIQLDTATGAIVTDKTWPTSVSEAGAQAYDGMTGTHIVFSSGSPSGWARLMVGPGPAFWLRLSPSSANLAPGGSEHFTGQVLDLYFNVRPDAVTFSMDNSAAGTISPDGRFTATTVAGTYTNAIRAQGGGLTDHASVTVQPGTPERLFLTPHFSHSARGRVRGLHRPRAR